MVISFCVRFAAGSVSLGTCFEGCILRIALISKVWIIEVLFTSLVKNRLLLFQQGIIGEIFIPKFDITCND